MKELKIVKTDKKYSEEFISKMIVDWFGNNLDEEDEKVVDGLRNGYEVYKYDDYEQEYFNLTEWNTEIYKSRTWEY